ncbi:MAG: hypothetical protein ACF8XB_14480, partial [Planctomycetota bacterium JB042]
RDVVPDPPTRRWRAGRPVDVELPTSFPLDLGLPRGEAVEIRLGFVDAETRDVRAPAETWPYESGLAPVAEMTIPTFEPVPDAAEVDARIGKAREFRAGGRPQDAWDVLELAIRMSPDDRLKARLRDEMLKLGDLEPRPLTVEERRIVRTRIEDEQARWFRLVAGRMFDRHRYHGALALLERVGGTLAERADDAVLGALDDAERTERRLEDVRQKLLDHVPAGDLEEVEALEEKLGLGRKLLERAEKLARSGRLGAARWLLRRLRRADDAEVVAEATARLPSLEAELLAAFPDDEREEVDAAIEHPAWARTVVVPSHRFLFIGPRKLVEGIPPESRLRFDLAYVFLTDLFGRVPNPSGDRVTVYFKELWDFGGGVGGGKTIDIGRADPDARGVRVDTGLLYHELTHCVDDTTPIFAGFREGLANVGAVYAFEAIGQREDGLHSFGSNLGQFRTDYLARDLEYWRIQNYGPSAGFFLYFLDRYAKRGDGHDWSGYRRFFREYRAAPVRDGREPFVARAIAHYLVRAFGDEAFDDLVRFRWPLTPADREAVGREIEVFDRGGLSDFADAHDRFPNSPLPRDLLGRELKRRAADGDDEDARAFGRERLGLVYAWKVIGPFSRDGVDPGAAVFPPEVEIDFEARYPVRNNIAFWTEPAAHAPVIGLPTGWVRIEFPYQDDTATYALTHVTVPAAVDAVCHVRADDDLSLFLNGERIGEYHGRGWNDSSRFGWRGPHFEAPDAIRFPVRLEEGRNELLLKVRNRRGPAGYSLALSTPDGRAIDGLVADSLPPDGPPAPDTEEGWKSVLKQSFRSSLGGKFDVTVGRFKGRNKAVQGVSTDKGVAWRKFTVRPGFPKDSPSNLAWLKESVTEDVDAFRLRLTTEGAEPPKLLVTFQGEGGVDGLSGWNLITEPRRGAIRARLERYDRLVYQCEPREAAAADEQTLEIEYADRRVTVRFGDAVLFDRVPIRPIAGRHRIGFATWGDRPRLRRLSLDVPKEVRGR